MCALFDEPSPAPTSHGVAMNEFPRRAAFGLALLAAPAMAGDDVANVGNADTCAVVHEVEISWTFTPSPIAIAQGDCIHFTNVHNIEHSAVGAEREFNTGIMMPGGTALLRFDAPAEIPYICGVHPPMTAHISVTPAD